MSRYCSRKPLFFQNPASAMGEWIGVRVRFTCLFGRARVLSLSFLTMSAMVSPWQWAQAKALSDTLTPYICQTPLIAPLKLIETAQKTPPNAPYQLSADRLYQPDPHTYELFGHTQLIGPHRILLSDLLWFTTQQEAAKASGHVRMAQPNLLITATEVAVNQTAQTLKLDEAMYQILPSRGYGDAEQVRVDKKQQRSWLKKASFTTCPLLSEAKRKDGALYRKYYNHDVAWEMSFQRLKLDDKTRRIYGYHGLLKFYQVPIFYLPYINTSMDERDTGLLFPQIGVHRSINTDTPSTYWNQPIYLNLAPNYDDTLSFLFLQNRGTALDNEFRYLNKTHRATLNVTGIQDALTAKNGVQYYLNSGQYQSGEKRKSRWRIKLDAQQNWQPNITSHIDWQQVSDQAFYADIPVESSLTTAADVPRKFNLNFQNVFEQSQLTGQFVISDYLRLRPDAPYNYERKPSLTLNYQQTLAPHWQAEVDGDFTSFELSHPNLNRPEGNRYAVQPILVYRWDKPYAFMQTQFRLHALHYQLQPQNLSTQNNTSQTDLTTLVPQVTLRSGLHLERNLTLFQTAYTQTLTPEFQWLYTPYQDQTKNPLFDTGVQSLDFSNLFALNRFSGYDRIGDTHQLTLALTTQLYDAKHQTQLKAAVGQIAYFEPQRITLTSTEETEAPPLSDYYSQVRFETPNWQLSNTSQWQRKDVALKNSNTRLQYQWPKKFKLLLNSQSQNLTAPSQKTETLAAGLLWQPLGQWQLGAYTQYDFTQQIKTDNEFALLYNNCCWTSEFTVREQQLQNGVYNYGFQFTLEFKGISTLGTPFSEQLQKKLNF